MKGIDFIFGSVCLLYYKCDKISLKSSWSYRESPDWIRNKTETINPRQ